MKARLLKMGVTLFLVAVLVVAGVLASHPGKSEAASKTIYNVVLQKGSTSLALASVNDGASAPSLGKNDGITFQMVIEGKAKTEKVKSTGGTASYYPVTLIAKSYRAPSQEYPMVGGGGTAVSQGLMAGDAKGKLYISGGDVDVSIVQGEKKQSIKIGDGKADPEGSLFVTLNMKNTLIVKETGKKLMDAPFLFYLTTAKSSLTVQNVKGGLNGKSLPDNDTTNTLPKPMVGEPVHLDAGTGTLVGATGSMNINNKMVGMLDYIVAQVWVMKITKQ